MENKQKSQEYREKIKTCVQSVNYLMVDGNIFITSMLTF